MVYYIEAEEDVTSESTKKLRKIFDIVIIYMCLSI